MSSLPAAVRRTRANDRRFDVAGGRDKLQKYREELGANAYALVNAASEYASDVKAPLMSPARIDALQLRCGRWIDRTVERYRPALASRPEVDISTESLNAAERLAAMERTGT